MPDDRDRLERWLSEPVRPLLPPPGAFEQIRRRARVRKRRQVLLSAAGVAVVVAGAALAPHLVTTQLRPGRTAAGPAAPHQPSPQRASLRAPTPLTSPSASPLPVPSTTPPPPVPPDFGPVSVTFVGTGTGWALGQAGVPGHCGPPSPDICTSIARTDDGGRTWRGVPAPVAGSPDGGRGVSQIRFLNDSDGWVFGPQLWATHDGGQRWVRIPTSGMRVTALETVNGQAYAVWARCSGTGPGYAAGCTSFALYSTPADHDHWSPVPGAGAGFTVLGTADSAGLVLTQQRAYLLPPSGILVGGPAGGGGSWQPVTSTATPATAPCTPGAAQPGGQPSQAMLASSGQGLILLCLGQPGAGMQGKTLYRSSDGGATWQKAGKPPRPGTATSLSGSPSGVAVLATTQGLEVSSDGGATWHRPRGAAPPGGFSYVGMTTSLQGVAVPANPGQHALWFTYDGGSGWTPSPLK